ncbi:peptide-methionine (S)-S-oxide reductase MsrA [Halegenticoccus tardaugens]|uniref:peptide-methionine (S)-S-oxide reductase MsrA n=1 Tax=Halegenticoccus tardaugens TaxID=2071624 RepID=UPI00100A93BE|nr:peptide-methionine (S)-S-oxide reductase MsrA [Halegenticoccus tardaugens]
MSERETAAQATLAGGCFWCIEAPFERLGGVESVVSGYAGGSTENPTYEEVCSGETGHAEVVQVTYDPDEIGYRELLEVFFTIHDPTTLNRQGPDVGTQYRSAVFYHDDEQRETAEALIEELEAAGAYDDPIVTEVEPLEAFYEAEEYHQNFYEKNPEQAYCAVHIPPKLDKLRENFASKLKG